MNSALSIALDAYARAVREEILRVTAVGSCVFSTRVTIEVFERLGVRAKPLSVDVSVFNEGFIRATELEGGWPKVECEDEFHAWCDRHNAWSIAVRHGVPAPGMPPGWAGHLVALVGQRPTLVDASAGQFSRPDKDLVLPGVLVAEVKAGFVVGKAPVVYQHAGSGSPFVVQYMAVPDDRSYTALADWNAAEAVNLVADRILERVREP